ncbi:MAG: phosphoribosylformylglycinamidine synthase subunit PurS [Armatimonadetes bacterium]|nr:phosphoribosylformylglycinamidine synthase subunit PurS [Armatimonadota bacterium]
MPYADIIVTLKPTLLDAQGRVVQNALLSLGYENVTSVRIGKYMRMELAEGEALERQVKEMCDRLLANPVIENYHFEIHRDSDGNGTPLVLPTTE